MYMDGWCMETLNPCLLPQRFIWSRHGTPPQNLPWPHQTLASPRLWPRRMLSPSPLQLSRLSPRRPLLLLRRPACQAGAERCYWARARVRRARCRAAVAPGGDRPRAPAAVTAAVGKDNNSSSSNGSSSISGSSSNRTKVE